MKLMIVISAVAALLVSIHPAYAQEVEAPIEPQMMRVAVEQEIPMPSSIRLHNSVSCQLLPSNELYCRAVERIKSEPVEQKMEAEDGTE